jgi:hypothetical protein
MAQDRVNLHDISVADMAQQMVAVTTDEPLTAKHIRAEFAAEHVVGKYDDDTLPEMCKESLRDSCIDTLDGESNEFLREQDVAGQQLVICQPKALDSEETLAVRESRRLEFINLSVGKGGFQVVATTTQMPITADGIHCGENAGQMAGRFSNKTALEMWKASHAAARQRKADMKASANAKAGAARDFEHEINSMK